MSKIETQDRYQKAVLWQSSGYDDYGKYLRLAPIELSVRWEEGRRQSSSPEDTVIAIDATVFVDREIPIGSIMWKGKQKDLPASPTGLKEVVSYKEVPDIKGRVSQRSVSLARYNEQLPDLAT
jgi:hypothetical protein